MRIFKSLIALIFAVVGVIFGALNKQAVHIDLGFIAIDARLGPALLMILLFGALLGGLIVTAGVVWPLRRRLHTAGGSGPDRQELAAERDA